MAPPKTIIWYRSDGTNWRVQVTTSADSGQTWSDVETLSEAGESVDVPQVAMSANGTTQTIIWHRSDGTYNRVQVTTSTDSGATWSDVETLSEAGQDAEVPEVAMSADGTTQTITWYRYDGAYDRVQVTTSTDSGATWSDVETLSEAGEGVYDPEVAMSADGTTQTITWERSDGADWRVQVTPSADSGATWSDVVTLSEAGENAWGQQVAMSADGTTQTTTWERYDGSDWRVQVTTSADSGQTWSDVETLSEAGENAWVQQVAMSADGTTQTITWERYDGSDWRVQVTMGDFSSVPSEPTAPGAAHGNGEVLVSWSAPVDDGGRTVTGYTVSSSPGIGSCVTASTSCVVSGLTNGTEYSFTVVATNTTGDSGPSVAVSATPSMVLSVDEIGVDCTVAQSHPFTDVATSSYAYGPVGCIYNLGVTTGISPTEYGPANIVTRAQMAEFSARFYEKVTGQTCTGDHPFIDVSVGSYAYGPVGCIYNLGVTTGISETEYGPANTVTRAQMAAFLARFYEKVTGQTCTGDHPFTDVSVGSYAYGPVGCIYNLGVTTGISPTEYGPANTVTRAQMAAFLERLYNTLTS